MAKKIVAVMGSYRHNKATETAVDEILRAAKDNGAEVEKINLMDCRIEFCNNCRHCTQEAGEKRGRCVHDDQMGEILDKLEAADGIVLACPTNFFTVTAVMKRFIERMVGYAYWPWGQNIPKPRTKAKSGKAVIVTSTACPAFIAKIGIRNPLFVLKQAAACLGCRIVKKLHFGMVANKADSTLSEGQKKKAYQAGVKLVS